MGRSNDQCGKKPKVYVKTDPKDCPLRTEVVSGCIQAENKEGDLLGVTGTVNVGNTVAVNVTNKQFDVNVTNQNLNVTVTNKVDVSGSSVTVDGGCVQVENKDGRALDVHVEGGCVDVSNCEDNALYVQGCVRVETCCDPLDVDGDVRVENKAGTLLGVTGTISVGNTVDVDGCVRVENKNGRALDVCVNGGCLEVHNSEDDPLFIDGCVNVKTCCDPLDVDGDVRVENKEGTLLGVTGTVSVVNTVEVDGCVQVENKEGQDLRVEVTNEKLDVKVCGKVCAITEDNLHNGTAVHFSSKYPGQTGGDGGFTYELIVELDTTDYGGNAVYPSCLTFSLCPDDFTNVACDDINTFQIVVGAVGHTGTVALEFDDLSCFPGEVSPCTFFTQKLLRLVLDLEKVFGTRQLHSELYPFPNGYEVRLSFFSTVGGLKPCFSVSGTTRCPQCQVCDFSVPHPVCHPYEDKICSNSKLDIDLKDLVDYSGEDTLTYEWYASDVPGGINGATPAPGKTTSVINDKLENVSDISLDVVYTYIVKSAEGRCVCTNTVIVTVCPPLEFGLTGPTGICCGTEYTVSVVGLTGGCTGPYTYKWLRNSVEIGETGPTFTTSLSCRNLFAPTHTFFNVLITDGCGCTGTARHDITIFDRPDCTIDLVNYCVNGQGEFVQATLSVGCTGGAPPFTYLWTGPDVENPPGNTGTSVTVGSTGYYCVVVTDSHGCTGKDCITVDEMCPPLE